jgi:hypothetical protein
VVIGALVAVMRDLIEAIIMVLIGDMMVLMMMVNRPNR